MKNIKTEAEAANIRCCGPEGCGKEISNPTKVLFPPYLRFCIGRECMAWQSTNVSYRNQGAIARVAKHDPDEAIQEGAEDLIFSGYCGYITWPVLIGQ